MRYLILLTLFIVGCGKAPSPKDGDLNPYPITNSSPTAYPVKNYSYCYPSKAQIAQQYGKPDDVIIYNDYASAFIYYSGLTAVFTPLSDETCNIQYINH